MDLFLSKLLPLFVYPLGMAFCLGLIALLLAVLHRRRAAVLLVTIAVAELWVSSTPAFANWLYARLEQSFPPIPLEDVPPADIAILLGGIVGQPVPPRLTADLSDATDRALTAARLFHAGKVQRILVTGGDLPWLTTARPEAELVADLLVEWGVPREALLLETASRNTYENAVNVRDMIPADPASPPLLITSAAHMSRAVATFAAAGVAVVPVPTDFRAAGPLAESALDFLPAADALAHTTDAIREWLGFLIYRLRGWA